jgi:hypothetical protein
MKRHPFAAIWAALLSAGILARISLSTAGAADATAQSLSDPTGASSGHSLWLQQGNSSDFLTPGKPAPIGPLPRPKGLEIGSVTGYAVRVAYISPTNRVAQSNGVVNLRNCLCFIVDSGIHWSPGMYIISGTTPYSRPTWTRTKPKSGEESPQKSGFPAVIARSSRLPDMNSVLLFLLSSTALLAPRAPNQIQTRRPSKPG